MLAPNTDRDVLARQSLDVVLFRELLSDALTRGHVAERGHVLGLSVLDRFDRGVLDRLRRIKVRLTSRETEHINPRRFHRLGAIVERDGDRWLESRDAIGEGWLAHAR